MKLVATARKENTCTKPGKSQLPHIPRATSAVCFPPPPPREAPHPILLWPKDPKKEPIKPPEEGGCLTCTSDPPPFSPSKQWVFSPIRLRTVSQTSITACPSIVARERI